MGRTIDDIRWGYTPSPQLRWKYDDGEENLAPVGDYPTRFGSLPLALDDGELMVVAAAQLDDWYSVRVLNFPGSNWLPPAQAPVYPCIPYEIIMGYQGGIYCRTLHSVTDIRYFYPYLKIKFDPAWQDGVAGEVRCISFLVLGGYSNFVCDGVHGWWSVVPVIAP